jgi:adenine-specific DNA-methyltransferase
LEKEERFFNEAAASKFRWEKYRDFCQATPIIHGDNDEVIRLRKAKKWNLFSQYYANTYFGVRQCLELDSIREIAEKNLDAKPYLIAAALSAMTYGVSSTTHLAQYLRPQSLATTLHLIKRRKFSFVTALKQRLSQFADKKNEETTDRSICQHDFRVMLNVAPLDRQWVIYADPPYFKEHYSRYYHVLNTFYLYDYPFLTYNNQFKCVTEGRYREGRNISDFGKKSLVRNAFRDLLSKCAETGCRLALSYAETSLVKKDEILNMANGLNLSTEIVETDLTHSSQGQAGRTKSVREYLFLIQ